MQPNGANPDPERTATFGPRPSASESFGAAPDSTASFGVAPGRGSVWRAPWLTLLAGLVLAAGLLVWNLYVTGTEPVGAPAGASVGAVASPSGAPTPTKPVASTPAPSPASPAAPAPPPAPPATYAGDVGGGGATVAIAVHDGTAVAYLCDGRTAEAWLQGTAQGGSLDLSGPGEAKLTGTFDAATANGAVSAAGRHFEFSVPVVTAPSGLYRATAEVRGAQLVGGWIVLADGRQVGLVKLGATTLAAPPLDPRTGTVTVESTTLTVTAVDGSKR